MKTKTLIFLLCSLPLQVNSVELKTEKGLFLTGEYVSFSGWVYSRGNGRLHYWFCGIVPKGETIQLDLTNGDTMMQSLYKKAIYECINIDYIMNENIDVDKFEYLETFDTSHSQLCDDASIVERTYTSFELNDDIIVSFSYCAVKGVFYFTRYSVTKDHDYLSTDYFHLDSLLEKAEVCVPFAILSLSKYDQEVFLPILRP